MRARAGLMVLSGAPRRVLALPRYGRSAASSRLRHYMLRDELAKFGYEIVYQPFFDDDYIKSIYNHGRPSFSGVLRSFSARLKALRQSKEYALIWAEKELLPSIPGRMQAMAGRGTPYVLDFDDDWIARYEERFKFARNRIASLMLTPLVQRAAAVTVANAKLAQEMQATCGRSDLAILPGVPEPLPDELMRTADDGERRVPVVGWIGNPLTATEFLPMVSDQLRMLLNDGVIELRLIGAGDAVPHLTADRRAWSEATQYEDLAGIDIGIMPITPSRFSEGKSSFKLRQYMALGKCFVATPIPSSVDLVDASGAGLLASTSGDWLEAILRLAKDPELRRTLGHKGKAHSASQPSLQEYAAEVARVFDRALSEGATAGREGAVPTAS